jgi:hypothetical protein
MRSISVVCTACVLSGVFGLLFAASTAQSATLDHYRCYKAKEIKRRCPENLDFRCSPGKLCQDQGLTADCLLGFPKDVTVLLEDQFEIETFDNKKPKGICVPTEKTIPGGLGFAIQDPNTHYKTYLVKRPRGVPAHERKTVLATDQFGDHILQTIKTQFLLVPTLKALAYPPPQVPDPWDRDHYKCYKVKELKRTCTGDLATKCRVDDDCLAAGAGDLCYLGFEKGTQVTLNDQFEGPSTVELNKPKLLCTPVKKNQEPDLLDPNAHLVGYNIKRPRKIGVSGVFLNNQYGVEAMTTIKEEYLLVPASKSLAARIEIDPFPNSLAKVAVSSPGGTEYVTLSGPTTVEVDLGGLADTDGDSLEQVETEIVSMSLTGTSTLVGPLTLRVRDPSKHPFQGTTGEIEENANNTPGTLDVPPFTPSGDADSFFDVFFEIETTLPPPLDLLHNDVPKHMSTTITNKPPGEGETYFDPGLIPLLTENEQASGVSIGIANHTPDPKLCADTSPICDGSCEPGEVCRNTGTACVCAPVEPIPCEATFAPQCDGFCQAPDLFCHDVGGQCACVPLF